MAKTTKKNEGQEMNEEIVEASEKKTKKTTKKSEETKEETSETKKRTSDRSVLLKELKEKAKRLAEGIEGSIDTSEIKEEFEKKRELLIPLEDYVRTGIHLGTKVITPNMKQFVYRRRADSIGVLNTNLIDENIKKAIDLMAKYEPNEIILSCKRESGWKAARLFSEVTGIKVFTKKYPAGMMTNTQLEEFYEPELIIVCDHWVDKNPLGDAIKTNKKKIMLADTNNFTQNVDLVIPCNNKGSKSLGLVFWLLARGYVEKKKLQVKVPSMYDFTGEDMQEVAASMETKQLEQVA